MKLFIMLLATTALFSHDLSDIQQHKFREWKNRDDNTFIHGSFLFLKKNNVYIRTEKGRVTQLNLNELSKHDQIYVKKRDANTRALNTSHTGVDVSAYMFVLLFSIGLFLLVYRPKKYSLVCIPLVISIYASCSGGVSTETEEHSVIETTLEFLDTAFLPFRSTVQTFSDETYYYIESKGLPEHNMMVGIKSWQQQVPIDQDYTGSNAWRIPLKPEVAETPLLTKENLFRGAIAIAVNGVPIFNALNNRGDDAYAVGELDEWGGHCGRADDYHYHIAPLHLEDISGKDQPIAFALDGFAVFGSLEPDGTEMNSLDEYHGHFWEGTYHYHGTKEAPYMISGMRGNITIKDEQIDPQPMAKPVRDWLTPLNGATITQFEKQGENAYSLGYTLNDNTHFIHYSWDESGTYTFKFIDASGASRTETYQR